MIDNIAEMTDVALSDHLIRVAVTHGHYTQAERKAIMCEAARRLAKPHTDKIVRALVR